MQWGAWDRNKRKSKNMPGKSIDYSVLFGQSPDIRNAGNYHFENVSFKVMGSVTFSSASRTSYYGASRPSRILCVTSQKNPLWETRDLTY